MSLGHWTGIRDGSYLANNLNLKDLMENNYLRCIEIKLHEESFN